MRRTAGVGLGINFDAGHVAAFAANPLALLDEVIGRVELPGHNLNGLGGGMA